MSLDSASNSSSSIPAEKCSLTTPINHFFGPDGIRLGVTYPETTCELLRNLHKASSYIDCQKDVNSKPS
jgi:hypothetical protein